MTAPVPDESALDEPLTEAEAAKLAECEARIRRGLKDLAAMYHPIANIFPPMEGEEFDGFAEDIKKNGLRTPITMFEGKILDGRNRCEACWLVGIKPEFQLYTGTDPVGFVISANLRRRHLNESQRAMIAVELSNLPAHRPVSAQICAVKSEPASMPQPQAAKMMNVSRRSVQTAKQVAKKGSPALVQAVKAGKLSVSAAEKEIGAAVKAPPKEPPKAEPDQKAQRKAQFKKREVVKERMTALDHSVRSIFFQLTDLEACFDDWEIRSLQKHLQNAIELSKQSNLRIGR